MDIKHRNSIDLSPPFTATQAHAWGLTDYDLRRYVRQGRIVRRRRGIYVGATYAKAADANPATSHALDVAVLQLALDSCDLVAEGPSAAKIHGLEFATPPPRRIHVVSASPNVIALTRDGYSLRRGNVPADDVVQMHGVPVTCAARTFVDVAADRGFVDQVVLADSGLHKCVFEKTPVFDRLDKESRYLPDVREALAFADARAESALESAGRAHFHLGKIPPPLLQVWLLAGIRVDFFWPQFRTVAEADGLIKYLGSSPSEVRRTVDDERERQRAVEAADFALFRFAWEDLGEPAKLLIGLQEAFARGLALRAS